MPAEVLLYLGPVRCGKTREMLRQYREALREPVAAIDRTLWLAPTARGAAAIRHELLADDLDACFSPGVMTFDQLTGLILSSGDLAKGNAISAATTRELLRRVIKTITAGGQLTHYRGAAKRTGFVDLVASHIRELRQYGIGPAAYAKAGGKHLRSAEHSELALIYAEYDRVLNSHALCDAEGRHIAACAKLAANACPRLQNLELVVVDGFSDFTHNQHELLRQLAGRAKQLLITLPSDGCLGSSVSEPPVSSTSSSRPDLFAKITATIAELKHFHPKLKIHKLPPRPITWPALDHLAQHLFRNPRQIPPPPAAAIASLDRLEIVEAAGPHDEIIQIARHIKKRLASNRARPSDIVVAFRSLRDAAPRIREVFTEYGIPFSLETGLPLATAAVLRTLLSLLRLDDEDWPFRRIVSVITNNTLTAIPDEARRATDWQVRDLQIAKGREALLSRVEQLAAIDTTACDLSEHSRHRAVQAKLALPALQLLAAAIDELPKKADPTEWVAALERLGTMLGLEPFRRGTPRASGDGRGDIELGNHALRRGLRDVPPDNSDHVAWYLITQHFAGLDRLDQALGESPRLLSRGDLLDWLIDVAGHESLPRPHDDAGRVRVLSAATARTISARHLYLANMSEQAFPSPERAGLLANAADYRHFAGVADQDYAVACPPAVNRPQEEMLLFYEVLTRAEESLTISFPALDDKAQVLPPSPYVTELLRTLGEAADQVKRTGPQLSPIPPATESPLSTTDWRIQAVAQAVGEERDSRLLTGVFQRSDTKPLAAALEAGLRITHARQRRDDFGPAEGVITSPAAVARLAQRFGPDHYWSPSQLEHYAACPYKFFLEDVLDISPLGEMSLETDFARRGSLLHRVLAEFHRQSLATPPDPQAAAAEQQAQRRAHFDRVLAAEFDAAERDGIEAALLKLDRMQIEKWAANYVDQLAEYGSLWTGHDQPPTPTHFELRFGPARPGDAGIVDERSVEEPLHLDIGGETIRVTGRIDRIDVGRIDGATVFNVIDYKSGKKPSLKDEHILSGERLQLPLYCIAAQVVLFPAGDAAPLAAGYWTMTAGYDNKGSLRVHHSAGGALQATERWQSIRPKLEQKIGELIRGIRQGQFPVFSRDDRCTSTCDYHTVCRVAQVRSLGKTWIPENDNPTQI